MSNDQFTLFLIYSPNDEPDVIVEYFKLVGALNRESVILRANNGASAAECYGKILQILVACLTAPVQGREPLRAILKTVRTLWCDSQFIDKGGAVFTNCGLSIMIALVSGVAGSMPKSNGRFIAETMYTLLWEPGICESVRLMAVKFLTTMLLPASGGHPVVAAAISTGTR